MSEYSLHLLELSEQISIINMGRLEHLVRVLWDRALQGDERSIRVLVDVMKLEMDWSRQIVAQATRGDDQTNAVERIEKTITSSNDLYKIALDRLETSMDDPIDLVDVDTLYSSRPPVDVAEIDARLRKLSDKVVNAVGKTKDGDPGH